MKLRSADVCLLVLWLLASGCIPRWTPAEGVVDLPAIEAASQTDATGAPTKPPPEASQIALQSYHLTLVLPRGWNYVMRGDDLLASKDGVFLQHIHVERIRIDQTDQGDGAFPYAALSTKQWPVRTGRYLTGRLTPEMTPIEVAEAVLASRKNNRGITDVALKEMAPQTIAGNEGFRAVLDFHVSVPPNTPYGKQVPGMEKETSYRSVCQGFMTGWWLYVISYTAARRHYFEQDAQAFEDVVRGLTVRVEH